MTESQPNLVDTGTVTIISLLCNATIFVGHCSIDSVNHLIYGLALTIVNE